MKIRFFNMIEVLLALGITAIGITGLMGIIPLGLNANRDALAETFTADIANTYFAQLNRKNAQHSFSEFYTSDIKFAEVSGEDITIDGNTVHVYKNPVTPPTRIPGPADLANDGINFDEETGTGGSYMAIRVGKAGTGVLPDFEADLCCWKCKPADIAEVTGSSDDLVRVYLEVSWPVSSPYANRQKRIFVREFYNMKAAIEEVTP